MFAFFRRKPKQPPGNSQVRLCDRLGLTIAPKMSRSDVSKLIERALQQEKYRAIYDEIEREREEEYDREERAEYGDEIVDELRKWEKICALRIHHIALFKHRGKTICEVIEFEVAEIAGERKYSIKLGMFLPKIHKDKDDKILGTYSIEWEKEVSVKSDQILAMETLSGEIDNYDTESYEVARARCDELLGEQATS